VKFAERPNMCYIFEKVMLQGPQKQCSRVSDVQFHKYTNTIWVKFANRPDIFETVIRPRLTSIEVWKTQNPHCLLCLVYCTLYLLVRRHFLKWLKTNDYL
jgi:hypothetical protein